jgi:L-asparagine oxygenase
MRLDREAVQRRGYLRLIDVNFNDIERIAGSFGPILMDARHPSRVRLISPQRTEDANQNTLSSRYGTGAFTFHTDCAHWERPASFLLLYCVARGSGRRPTHLIDSCSWDWSPEMKIAACSEVWSRALLSPQLCTLGARCGDRVAIRYDEDCMRPLTRGAERVRDFVRDSIETSRSLAIEWSNGDVLVIDNARMLHARGAAISDDQDRVLARVLIGRYG